MSKKKHPSSRYHRRLFDKDLPYYNRTEDGKKGKGSYDRNKDKFDYSKYKDTETD